MSVWGHGIRQCSTTCPINNSLAKVRSVLLPVIFCSDMFAGRLFQYCRASTRLNILTAGLHSSAMAQTKVAVVSFGLCEAQIPENG